MVATRPRWALALAALSFTRALSAADAPVDVATGDVATAAPPTTALDSQHDAQGPTSERERQAEARRLRALRFWDLRSLPAAREELLAAYELSPRPLFLYNLAVTSMALGDSAAAYDYFESYLRQGGSSVPAQRRATVERQLLDLAEHVATLHVSADVAGAQVWLDGKRVATTPASRSLRLNVGDHSLTVRRAEDSQETRRLTVRGGQSLQLHFALLAHERRRAAEKKRTHWQIAGWTSTGLLGAGAALAGWRALVAHDRYRAAFGEIDPSRQQLDRLDAKALRWSVTADVLAASALAAGACSLYLTLKPISLESDRRQVSAKPKVHELRIGISSNAAYVAGAF